MDPDSVSREIRSEADRILASGLLAILERYGDVHLIGSYALGLMTWRDLDCYLVHEQLDAFDRARRFGDSIASRLGDEARAAILAIKTACWQHPQYRWGFTSADVYAAVRDRGVRDPDAFWLDLRQVKGIAK